MICANCRTVIPDGSAFCPSCGTKLENSGAGFFSAPGDFKKNESAPTELLSDRATRSADAGAGVKYNFGEKPRSSEPFRSESAPDAGVIYCPKCGASMPKGAKFCGVCAYRFEEEPTFVEKKMSPRTKKKLLIALISVAAACLLLFATIGIVKLVSGAGGPLAQISSAVRKTVDAGSFSVNCKADGERGTMQWMCSPEDEELAYVARLDNYSVAVYDGYLISKYSYSSYARKQNIRDELEDYFDLYNNHEDMSLSQMLKELDPDGDLYRSVSETFKIDELEDCLKVLAKKANDEDWLREYAGFDVSEKKGVVTYSFDLDADTLEKLAREVLSILKPAFRTSADYYSAMEEIDISGRFRLQVEISVEGKYLSSVSVSAREGSYSSTSYTFDFYDVGETEIDMDELAYWLSIAEY